MENFQSEQLVKEMEYQQREQKRKETRATTGVEVINFQDLSIDCAKRTQRWQSFVELYKNVYNGAWGDSWDEKAMREIYQESYGQLDDDAKERGNEVFLYDKEKKNEMIGMLEGYPVKVGEYLDVPPQYQPAEFADNAKQLEKSKYSDAYQIITALKESLKEKFHLDENDEVISFTSMGIREDKRGDLNNLLKLVKGFLDGSTGREAKQLLMWTKKEGDMVKMYHLLCRIGMETVLDLEDSAGHVYLSCSAEKFRAAIDELLRQLKNK